MSLPRDRKTRSLDSEQRQMVLSIWDQSGLPAKDFAPLVGVSHHTLYAWRQRFKKEGAAGLENKQRGPKPGGSRLPEATQKSILELKAENPDWGVDRIAGMLHRWGSISVSPGAIQRVLTNLIENVIRN